MSNMGHIGRRTAWLLIRLLPAPVRLRLRQRRYLAALRGEIRGEPELTVVAALVKPGDHCVDIGANFGVYTVALSRMVGATGRVISVEPVAETYGLLTRSLSKLGLTNTLTLQAAVSNEDGEVAMEVPRWDYGAPNFYQAHVTDAADANATSRVPSRRLDSILADIRDRVSFIKCDVEGHELAVLRGAPTTLETGAAWLIEVSGDPDQPGSTAGEVVSHMARAGYGVYRYADGVLAPRAPGDRFINYFFLQPWHVERLQEAGLMTGSTPQ